MLQRTARLTTKEQVTVPADVRRILGVRPHAEVTFVVVDDEVRLTSAASITDRIFSFNTDFAAVPGIHQREE
jgi:bifunctional DNA-binding transcriptional regulator/antitoxin component of YhaV-PrlF toxin-antitoxin module